MSDIRGFISELSKYDFDLIVGIPRSGMIPAYTIGLYLNVDVTDLNSLIHNTPIQRGTTRITKGKLHHPHEAKKILLVDDSYTTGGSMKLACERIPKYLDDKISKMVIYSSTKDCEGIDIYLRVVNHPRLFEWNILNHNIIKNSCFDIDGVLCVDPSFEQNDDGEKYIDFLKTAKPKFIPKYKIKYLVTNRLEKYREYTIEWLKRNNVEYQELIMLNMETKEERQRTGIHSKHKANFYKKSECELFVESDSKQAFEIMTYTGKPVYCIDDNKMYTPGSLLYLSKRPTSFMKDVILFVPKYIYQHLPLKIKIFIKQKLKP